jgi:hypothetical protein
MSEKIEGTVVLDGLIEGPLGSPQVEEGLREWARAAADDGLRFSLAVEGGTFNILAVNKPVPADQLGSDVAARVERAIRDLRKLLPPDSLKGLFSTLRSTEYRKGQEVQTLYVIAPDGALRRGQRIVEADTAAPPPPVTRKDKVKMAVTGVVVALLVLAVSSIFVDYRAMLGNLRERFTPLNPDAIQVEAGPFAAYFAVEKKSSSGGGRAAVLTLKRTAAFPITPEDCQHLMDGEAGEDLASRLAVEALARGYVRCELYGKDDEFLGVTQERIAELRRKETFDLSVPMPPDRHPTRIVITY